LENKATNIKVKLYNSITDVDGNYLFKHYLVMNVDSKDALMTTESSVSASCDVSIGDQVIRFFLSENNVQTSNIIVCNTPTNHFTARSTALSYTLTVASIIRLFQYLYLRKIFNLIRDLVNEMTVKFHTIPMFEVLEMVLIVLSLRSKSKNLKH
jgi:hypothetical protein